MTNKNGKNSSVKQFDIRLIGKPGDWVCSGEGYSGDTQPTRSAAFTAWLATYKARSDYEPNYQPPQLAGV